MLLNLPLFLYDAIKILYQASAIRYDGGKLNESAHMMIMISPEDFRQLSPSCQQEILSLLTRGAAASSPLADEMPPQWEDDAYPQEDESFYPAEDQPDFAEASPRPPMQPSQDGADGAQKQVLDISVTTARELIANVSSKSQTALSHFATGQPVALASLIGLNAPYRDLNELKRSLVGAVNRRLRTVTDNRAAVLFASDRDKQRIRITARSAASLRQALNLPEPLPAMVYVDVGGRGIDTAHAAAKSLHQAIASAWKKITARPLDQRHALLPAQIYQFLRDQGFSLCTGKPLANDDEMAAPHYVFDHGLEVADDLIAQIDPYGNIKLSTDDGLVRMRVFVRHTDSDDALATLALLD